MLQQYSSMSITGAYLLACLASERGIVLRGAFVNPTPMMCYRACLEMLHGVRLLISWVDCHGVVVGQLVDILHAHCRLQQLGAGSALLGGFCGRRCWMGWAVGHG
jgi:hypothetical protein